MNKRLEKLAAPTEEEVRIADLESQLAEALRLGKVGFHQMKALWMHDLMLVRHWHQAYKEAKGKLDEVVEVREIIRRKNLTAWHIGEMLDRILKEWE